MELKSVPRPIIDAGPGLNFFSIQQERLLFACTGPLSAPDTVLTEIRRKAGRDARFAAAARVLDKLNDRWLEALSDDETDELALAVQRLSLTPMADRMKQSKDLGEVMVLAHATVLAEAGQSVVVIIDEKNGQRMAKREDERLTRLQRQPTDRSIGRISLLSTERILVAGAHRGLVRDRADMRKLYARLRQLDDGLLPIENTSLLHPDMWRRPEPTAG